MAVRRKRIIRALLALFMAPFAMILLLGILLYLPPIQRWGVKQATDYLSRQTGQHRADTSGISSGYPSERCGGHT